jgi:hypothetical protein
VTAGLMSLSLVNVSNVIRSAAPLVVEGSDGDEEGEFSSKIDFSDFLHSYAMEAAHWAYLFDVMNSPYVYLACLRTASRALPLSRSCNLSIKRTENDEV